MVPCVLCVVRIQSSKSSTIFMRPASLRPDRHPSIIHLDEVDLMPGAEGLHQLDVHGLTSVGRKDAEMSLAPEEGTPG